MAVLSPPPGTMPELVQIERPYRSIPEVRVDPECLEIRRRHFDDEIVFHAPGLKKFSTSEYTCQRTEEFVSISLTGTACALNCEHCQMQVLKGMLDLTGHRGNLFDLCKELKQRGARGVLISGGSDRQGRVPLLPHIPDLIRVRRELGMTIRVHPGLPDEETCRALAEVDIDGAMIDIIGHRDTIRDIYHLDAEPEAFEACLERFHRYRIPSIPHIILGLHFGRMLGEWRALEMIAKYPPKILVLVIIMPLTGTPIAGVEPPSLEEIGGFFELARKRLPETPIMLGCAKPLGSMKVHIDRLAIDAGFNGLAYPSDGMIAYARERQLQPKFVNACCGVNW